MVIHTIVLDIFALDIFSLSTFAVLALDVRALIDVCGHGLLDVRALLDASALVLDIHECQRQGQRHHVQGRL